MTRPSRERRRRQYKRRRWDPPDTAARRSTPAPLKVPCTVNTESRRGRAGDSLGLFLGAQRCLEGSLAGLACGP